MDRTIALSLVRRDNGYDFVDGRGAVHHPMDLVARAALRFREYDPRTEGVDLERLALILAGKLPNIGLDLDSEPWHWEREYAIWGAICCRESQTPYCKRAFAFTISAHLADQLEQDIAAVASDRTMAIGTLTTVLTGRRENEAPPMVTTWPNDGVTIEFAPRQCVLVALHVNGHNRGAHEHSCWRVIRNARATKTGVTVDEKQEFNGFSGLQNLALAT
jgi:hypothetical protein